MPLRPFGQLTNAQQIRFARVLEALGDLTVHEDLEIASQLVVALLKVGRDRFAPSPADRGAYDDLCDDVLEWLRREVSRLRFGRVQ